MGVPVVASIRDLEDDANLVLAAQAGDQEAFAELFRRHYAPVRRVCARRLGSLVDADEVAQAAFVRALERIELCGGEHRFGPWVQVIAARMCIDSIRARTRTTPEEDPYEGRTDPTTVGLPEESLLADEQRRQVHKALATLPVRQREVVIARHLEDRRPPEIAAALGLSLGAVDSLLLRARRRLASSVQSASNDAGTATLTTLSSAAAAGLTTTVASTDNPLSRLASAAAHAVHAAASSMAAALIATPGVSGASEKVAASAAAGLLALSLSVAPAPRSAPQAGSGLPAAPVAVPGPAKPDVLPSPSGVPTSSDFTSNAPRTAPIARTLPSTTSISPPTPAAEAGPAKPEPVDLSKVVNGVADTVDNLLQH
ncbi:MAG: polymerase sigma-70 factor, subfamily [Actinomycetota bacterium]|nr:polymerase sigma-70 factor, subfamily [Actinomycetota bacterium]